ncbi:MAG: sulfotransferase domain-containing protein, partial [Gemmatimonadota bacterium]|nr:sulfotransferase domain-containing protein [Gemmatimonadota bacterium]
MSDSGLLPLPGFLGIGAMRAGTSWLATHLGRHPELWIGRKEIHFFDRKLSRRRIPFLPADLEARFRYALRFAPSLFTGRMPGELTPAYALLDRATIETVRRWMPEVRLLFIMRDPVERAWSQARHDYAVFLGRDAADAPEAELRAFFDRPGVRRRSDYAGCLEAWLDVFPRERLFPTFLEDVRSDPAGVLRSAFAFLGVEPDVPLADEVASPVHRGADAPLPAWARRYLTERLRPGDARLEAIVGRPLPWSDA